MSVSDRIIVMCEGKITGEFTYEQASEKQIMACATGQIDMINNEMLKYKKG
jgi:D-xylose transport system ATP-binding protein